MKRNEELFEITECVSRDPPVYRIKDHPRGLRCATAIKSSAEREL